MKHATLIIVAAALLAMLPPAWAGEAAPSAGAAASESPIGVVGEVKPRRNCRQCRGSGLGHQRQRDNDGRGREARRAYHGPAVLQDAVAEILLAQEAAAKGVTLSEEEIQQTVTALREQLGVRSEGGVRELPPHAECYPSVVPRQGASVRADAEVLADQVYVSDREVEAHYKRNQEMYRRGETVAFRLMSFADKAKAEAALADVRKGRASRRWRRPLRRHPRSGQWPARCSTSSRDSQACRRSFRQRCLGAAESGGGASRG